MTTWEIFFDKILLALPKQDKRETQYHEPRNEKIDDDIQDFTS